MPEEESIFIDIQNLVSGFSPIYLRDLEVVKLLDRREKKFIMPLYKLDRLLESVKNDYKVLEIDGQRLLEYSTEYYDTVDNAMYLAHYHGRQKRYKVRRREYLVSGEKFLEVKKHLNRGGTHKKRVEIQGDTINIPPGQSFIEAATPYQLEGLQIKLENSFFRITIVNTLLKERITIDLGLRFANEDSSMDLSRVVIIEVKKEGLALPSSIELQLRKMNIHSTSVSKYCIGRALLEPDLKASLFQNKIRYLVKLNSSKAG